jgi:hypothetical protein
MRHHIVWGSSLCHTRLMTGKHEGSRIHESILNTPSKITKLYLEYTEFHNCTPFLSLVGWNCTEVFLVEQPLEKKHCLEEQNQLKSYRTTFL